MKQKRVLDLLNTTRNNFTVAELHNELGFSCSDPVLWDMLIQNPKIQQGMHERRTRMEPTVSYKPKHVFEGKREMLELVTKMPDGVLMDDVADAYTGALEDCEALIEEGLVLMLTNAENRERVLYPIDEKYECDVDDDIAFRAKSRMGATGAGGAGVYGAASALDPLHQALASLHADLTVSLGT